MRSPTSPKRDRMERDILTAAERLFARHGFDGVAIAAIADELGISKQNLLYYFPSKEVLYERVLNDVLDDWLARMDTLAGSPLPPAQALRQYIAAKLRFSRERPDGSKVYANEIISGARRFGPAIQERVLPALRRDIDTFSRWRAEGHTQAVDATHLMFAIWSATQAYADFSAQMALLMGKPKLSRKDFAAAEDAIFTLVAGALGLEDEATAA